MFSRSISDERQNQSFGSPKEKMLRNSNIFKQQGETERYLCVKHPNKKAKYYADNNHSKMFCSKCALTMALKGLKIEETPSEEEFMRKNRISLFTHQLSNLIGVCEEKSKLLADNTNALKCAYNLQKDRCAQYFDTMITKLSQLKQQYLSKLSTTFTAQLQQSQSMLTLMKSSDAQLNQFLADIEKNVDNIVKKMEMRPFEEIMTRYETKVEEHQLVIDSTNLLTPLNDILALSRDQIETQIAQVSDKILHTHTDLEALDGDDIYQSTCSGMSNKPTHSPMRLPPFPKSQQLITNNSLTRSGVNTPDCKVIVESVKKLETYLEPAIMKEYSSEVEQQSLNSIALQLKLGLSKLRENKTPKHLKQQSCQPVLNNSESHSQLKNGSEHKDMPPCSLTSNMYTESHLTLKNKSIEANYNGLVMQRKMQATKRSFSKGQITQQECSKSEGKRQLIQLDGGEETLKDRIFKELAGGESIYNQVLKINHKKPTRSIKDKENFLSTDWGQTSLRKHNTYLGGLLKK